MSVGHSEHKSSPDIAKHDAAPAAKPAAAAPPVAAVQSSPGVGYSGNGSHDANVVSATLTKQTTEAAATTQAQLTAAAITFHRSIARSALANGVSPSVSMQALKSLGVTGL